jgi:hypothetical protein
VGAYQAEIEAGVRFGNMWTKLMLNQQKTGVVNGLAVTEDTTDLTLDVAAGGYVIDGVLYSKAAAANADTLEPDSSTRRMAVLGINAAGTIALFHGDAASLDADGNELSAPIPDIGEYAPIKGYILKAGQLLASDYYLAFDLRIPFAGEIVKVRTADATAVQSDDTPNDDDTLTQALPAATRWAFEALVIYTSGTTPDFKVTVNVPADAVLHWQYLGQNITSGVAETNTINADATAVDTIGTGTALSTAESVWIRGVVEIVTAGSLAIAWSQDTSDASDTVVRENSYLLFKYLGTTA